MAKYKLDQLVIVDVESTCWEGPPPFGERSEIIEIGVCLLGLRDLVISGPRSILVRPAASKVSPFCEKLTTLRQQDVDGGVSLYVACQVLEREYNTHQRTWASYGDYDRNQFQRNCREANAIYPFGDSHINIKRLAAMLCGWNEEVGMAEALKRLNLKLEGIHHRGGDDARNIAAIMQNLLRRFRQ